MPATTELAIEMDNRPGTLGKVCGALAGRGVNILAFQLTPSQKRNHVYIVVDDLRAAKTALNKDRITYTEAEVVQVKLPHRPGELARAASRLGEANININYAYCGVEPSTNALLVIFGVTEVDRAATILDQTAAASAGT
jgi:hypothetical protein